jgi:hypothetical protein
MSQLRKSSSAASQFCPHAGGVPEPPTNGRARDAEIRGDGHVAGASDEVSLPVVIALLRNGEWSSWG